MKNLLIYIHPEKDFVDTKDRPYTRELAKIQIENSLELGWKPKDIVLVTNFRYKHCGVEAQVVDDSLYCDVPGKARGKASKINVFLHLLKNRQVKPDELWWFHDLDAFQIEPITKEELELYRLPLGLTDYGWNPQWNTGSVFFTSDAERIFGWVRNVVYKQGIGEEPALEYLTEKNYQYINLYIKRLNCTYNYPGCGSGAKYMKVCWERANKPIKVLHFHPHYKGTNYISLLRGNNEHNYHIMPDRLYKFFEEYIPKLCD
jgi:hypothetical protein